MRSNYENSTNIAVDYHAIYEYTYMRFKNWFIIIVIVLMNQIFEIK